MSFFWGFLGNKKQVQLSYDAALKDISCCQEYLKKALVKILGDHEAFVVTSNAEGDDTAQSIVELTERELGEGRSILSSSIAQILSELYATSTVSCLWFASDGGSEFKTIKRCTEVTQFLMALETELEKPGSFTTLYLENNRAYESTATRPL